MLNSKPVGASNKYVCAVGGQQNTVVVTIPNIQLGPIGGSTPVQTMCTNCQQSVVTSVSFDTGAMTWLIAAILCFIGSVLQFQSQSEVYADLYSALS